MNFFSLIFSFYLLGISCLPCGDKKECNSKSDTTYSAPVSHSKHNHDENCTPFCSCSCCATFVSLKAIAFYKFPKLFTISLVYPVYDVTYRSQVASSVWQPPKLS